MKVPLTIKDYDRGAEYWLRVSLHEKRDRLWAEAGHEVGKEQLALWNPSADGEALKITGKRPKTTETAAAVTITGKNFTAIVDKTTGELTSYRLRGHEQLSAPLKLNFTRPFIDNDIRGAGYRPTQVSLKYWKPLAKKLKTSKVVTEDRDQQIKEVTVYRNDEGLTQITTSYAFHPDGRIGVAVNMEADASLPDLIRFGLTMGVPARLAETEYYGNGPWENYPDRKRGAEVGKYAGATDDLFHSYAVPQENGNRTETRWLQLKDKKGSAGLRITGDPVFAFSVWPYSADAIAGARHPYDLSPQGFYTLNIDHVQMGLGGTLSNTLHQYLLKAGRYAFRFSIAPVK